MKKILLLTNTQDNSDNRLDLSSQLASELNQFNDVEIITEIFEKLVFKCETGKINVSVNRYDLDQFDLIYLKNWFDLPEIAACLALYCKQTNTKLIPTEANTAVVRGKQLQMVRLASSHIAIPKTFFTAVIDDGFRDLSVSVGFPQIIKASDSKKGIDNYLVKSEEQLDTIIDKHSGEKFVIQEHIPNDSDYRVLCFGDEPKFAFKRSRLNDVTHMNNTSQGAGSKKVELNDLPESVLKMCTESCAILKREIAGVDVMQNKETRDWVLLEVNAGPQLITGAFVKDKIKALHSYLLEA